MARLTYNEAGKFGVIRMNEHNADEKVYACIKKLCDYEDTGLEPEDIVRCNCWEKSKFIDAIIAIEEAEKQLKQAKNKISSLERIVRACDSLMMTNGKLHEENKELKKALLSVHAVVDKMADYILDDITKSGKEL